MSEHNLIQDSIQLNGIHMSSVQKKEVVKPFSSVNAQSDVLVPLAIELKSPIVINDQESEKGSPRELHYKHIQYIECFNLAFERVCMYNIFQVLDYGVYRSEWTSYRLRTQTIYFDDESCRYELKRYAKGNKNFLPSRNYCLSVIKQNYIFDKQTMIPFDKHRVIILERNISWHDIIWGIQKVTIKGRILYPHYLAFYSNSE